VAVGETRNRIAVTAPTRRIERERTLAIFTPTNSSALVSH
jgi:hypothetical protein